MKLFNKSKGLSFLSLSSLILAACTANNAAVDKKIMSFSTTGIGSFNYALEQINNRDVLQLFIEPLIKMQAPSVIRSYLKNDHLRVRKYEAQDTAGPMAHALDFDVNKITKDKQGFYDPRTDHGSDTYNDDGLGWKPLPGFDAGAIDVMVTLNQEQDPNSISSDNSSANTINNRIIRVHLRDNLHWSNGDKVTPEDYITTIKYILDPARGSDSYNTLVNAIQLHNASLCYVQRSKLLHDNPGMSDYLTWNQAPACQSHINQKNAQGQPIPNSGLGIRDLGHNWLELEFDTGNDNIFDLLGSNVFLPMSQKFIDSLPRKILDFGLSAKNFLTDGAMNLTQFAPEYELVGTKNPKYWDAEDVFSKGVTLRVLLNDYAKINLYRNNYISEIFPVPPQFLPILSNDPKIAKTIKRGSGGNIVKMLRFSPYFLAQKPSTAYFNDPDFRRALYYGLNRVKTLEAANYFGVIPSGLSFPSVNLTDSPGPGQQSLYTLAKTAMFTPDYPGAQPYALSGVDATIRGINKYSNYLGVAPVDRVYKPKLAKEFMARWVKKYHISNPTLNFDFTSDIENLAISLKHQFETLFHDFNFKLNLVPQLSIALTAKALTGNFSMIIDDYQASLFGTSSYNWFMPFATTAFANDRRFANLTKFNGDTLGAYARRLAQTEAGRARLLELGFDANPFHTTQAANFYKVLNTLDGYMTADDPEIQNLVTYGTKNNIRYGANIHWHHPQALSKADVTKNYIFQTGLAVSSNSNVFFNKNGIAIPNPLIPIPNNQYGINNGYQLADFYLALEKLMRDGAFSIPISSYATNYYATTIVGGSNDGKFGMPRNLTHAYRYDAGFTNLPGEEILNINT